MSPVAFAATGPNAVEASANVARATKPRTKVELFIRDLTRTMKTIRGPVSSSRDLRTEMDRLVFPLLIKGAILGRHRQRIAHLHSLQHALCLRLHRRVGRRIDQFRRPHERSVRLERES